MKTLYPIIAFVAVAFLMFFGVSQIGQLAFINGNLDEESINALALYDAEVAVFQSELAIVQNSSAGLENYQPDANLIDEFIVEYSETKDRATQLKDAATLLYKIPDLLFLAVPFVDNVDLTIYRNMIWFLISITLATAIFNAIANRRITNT